MKDVLATAAQWSRAGRAFAVATVVGLHGSAPRELGASMLIGADGAIVGNVSGGCVEGAVVEEAAEVLATGVPRRMRYGISDDEVFGIGLTCGGTIEVLVRRVAVGSDAAAQLCVLADGADPRALVLTAAGDGLGETVLLAPGEGSGVLADAAALAGSPDAALLHEDADGCLTQEHAVRSLLVTGFGDAPRLIVVGAVAFAAALARLGVALGYRTTVVDARSAFAVPSRFPGAEVVAAWPDRYLAETSIDARTSIAVLSHDPKFDVPALQVALASPAMYVGAMGSRRTHAERIDRLRQAGITETQLARLRSPIGLDLGGRSPEETALSILAEIVAVRHGASGMPLTDRRGAIHAPVSSLVGEAPDDAVALAPADVFAPGSADAAAPGSADAAARGSADAAALAPADVVAPGSTDAADLGSANAVAAAPAGAVALGPADAATPGSTDAVALADDLPVQLASVGPACAPVSTVPRTDTAG